MIGGIRKVVIIIGCQRSGTTLTGQILGAHENAVLVDEFEGLYPWFHAAATNDEEADRLTFDVLERSQSKYKEPRTRFVTTESGARLSDRIDTLVLKAPNLTYSYEAISELECRVHIIYPIRDPRAVIASMQRLSHIDFVGNQRRWMQDYPGLQVRFGRAFDILDDAVQPHHVKAGIVWKIKSGLRDEFEKCGLPVLQFLYEDLVANPKAWISKLLAFCDMPPSEKPYSHESVYIGFGPGKTDRQRAVDMTGLDSWKTVLLEEQAVDILQVAQPLAKSFGYD